MTLTKRQLLVLLYGLEVLTIVENQRAEELGLPKVELSKKEEAYRLAKDSHLSNVPLQFDELDSLFSNLVDEVARMGLASDEQKLMNLPSNSEYTH
ncbi:hypothetical protein BH753_gp033 [Bacillus phage Shbh1]|uniref:Uncharacterized protein n=1 Tax=Bacillus phage Shbh1 TaxID=1796992 RepID=A0A142F158_9CAUD|nr:hypothetical protein BH753_gp033 [Bacillus phage Shbh1]AMQ66515.1 hypothetical protein [Bacillus phage Shbh1]